MGAQPNWWEHESDFEVIIGAILTQQTTWRSVKIAIANLKSNNILNIDSMRKAGNQEIEESIRPSGFYRQKRSTIRNMISLIDNQYGSSLLTMHKQPKEALRTAILSVKGIGEESADSILLYGFNKPSFVVDAYTRRITSRALGVNTTISYQKMQEFMINPIPKNLLLYKKIHANIVELAKKHCIKKDPLCGNCPVREMCVYKKNFYLH